MSPILTKNIKKIHWTNHAKGKMFFYRLSESRVKRVINSPKRIEEGIAPDTMALMQKSGTEKNPKEIWVMVQDTPKTRKIISAWRYPGATKPGEPLPEEILREFNPALAKIRQRVNNF